MWGCFITPWIPFFFAVYDANLWVDRKPQNHFHGWLLMAFISILPGVFFMRAIDIDWFLEIPLVFSMLCLFLWLTFDGLYNILIGQKFFFTGTGGAKDNSKLDEWLRTKTPKQVKLIKTIPLSILVLTYILIFL